MGRPRWVFTLCFLSVAAAAGCGSRSPGRERPIVLITIDTLRADRLGVYGGTWPTPALDRPGREGAVAETAVAPFGRTTQSVGTILTGTHPLRHGADGLGMTLPSPARTLAEILGEGGYDTAAFISNLILKPGMGFEQGFTLFSNPESRWSANSAAAITEEALAWLGNRPSGGKPFFLWLHYFDPHWPYEPGAPFLRQVDPEWTAPFDIPARIQRGEIPWGKLIFFPGTFLSPRETGHIARRYDGEVLQTEAALSRLWSGMEKTGILDRSLVVLTSDHGESLGEQDYWFAHGEYLYESTLRVPLLFRAPGLIPAGTRLRGTVRLEDIAPTLLDLAGFPVPPGMDGQSLSNALRGGGQVQVPGAEAVHLTDHLLVRAENPRRPVPGREGRWWALRQDSWKLIRIPLGEGRFAEELYDLASDPQETRNLAQTQPDRAARLRQRLESLAADLLQNAPTDEDRAVDPADRDRLMSLGYAH